MNQTTQQLESKEDQFAIIEYGVTDSALAELKAKYADMPMATRTDYRALMAGIHETRGLRTSVEKHRKMLKADSLAWGRKVDAEAKRITAALTEIEVPMKELKLAEDARIAEEVYENERVAKQRIDDLKALIDERFGQHLLTDLAEQPITQIHDAIAKASAYEIDNTYQDFTREAGDAQDIIVHEMKAVLWRRMKRDEEDKSRAEEDARLAKEREKLEADKAALREKQAIEHAKLDADRKKMEAEQKAKHDEEMMKLKKDREALAAEKKKIRLAQEEEQRLIDEEKARLQAIEDAAEAERVEAERLAANQKLEEEEATHQAAMRSDRQKIIYIAAKSIPTFLDELIKMSEGFDNTETIDLLIVATSQIKQIATELLQDAQDL